MIVAQKIFTTNVLPITSITIILHQKHTDQHSKPLSTVKKFQLHPQYYLIINLLLTLMIKQILSMISSLDNVKLYQTIARSHQFRLLKIPIHEVRLISIRKKILKITQDLNSNKAHGHGGISSKCSKFMKPPVIKPLSFLFNDCLRDAVLSNKMYFQSLKT